MKVRRVQPHDLEPVVAMVHELAAYERAPDQCHLTVEHLDAALFGPSPALFGHVAEDAGAVVGSALWFLNFSTWDGVHGIYLEDLYVRASAGGGVGRLDGLSSQRRCLGQSRAIEVLLCNVSGPRAPAISRFEPETEVACIRRALYTVRRPHLPPLPRRAAILAAGRLNDVR